MKTLIKTKLLEGKYLEVRDYEMGEPLRIIHCETKDYKNCSHENEQVMFLSVTQQKKGKVVNTQQSKFPPYKYYKMYKFLWKSAKQNQDVYIPMTNVMSKMVNTPEWEKLRQKLHS